MSGKNTETAKLGPEIEIDIGALIDTRLMIQANSGGGKSYAIRKLLETTHGKVHQIVLDIEGDFSSLREQYEYVIAGKGGDIVADPKSAELLAMKVLELKADIIIDLYELKQHDRIRFVELFLEAMVNAPKALWHPVLLILDEAHIFCPEMGKAESKGAVIDMCTRGRKRGFCTVLATQRISKLHKDAAAECNNKMIGRTGLDIDVKRSADELGLPVNKTTLGQLRNMKPGQFYVFGPAISQEVSLGSVDKVKTTHGRAGQRGLAHKPPPSAGVREKLAKLADLPEQAAEEVRDRTALQARVRELERELKTKPKPELDEVALEKAMVAMKKQFEKQFGEKMATVAKSVKAALDSQIDPMFGVDVKTLRTFKEVPLRQAVPPKAAATRTDRAPGEISFGACERAILGFLATQPDKAFTQVQVGAMAGYRHSSGGFNNSLSKLNKNGLINRTRGSTQISLEGLEWVKANGAKDPHTLEDWIKKLGACERKVYEIVLSEPEVEWSKEDLAENAGYSGSSGGFNNALSRLNTLGLIVRDRGTIRFNDALREIG